MFESPPAFDFVVLSADGHELDPPSFQWTKGPSRSKFAGDGFLIGRDGDDLVHEDGHVGGLGEDLADGAGDIGSGEGGGGHLVEKRLEKVVLPLAATRLRKVTQGISDADMRTTLESLRKVQANLIAIKEAEGGQNGKTCK